eukprot:Tbor_TRINITY_DN6630_c0_g1::TRINITY_DN6630_c0_g1_i1::g.3091::m.3091/K06178/rluB; 23S rRNA pseudouridine2605 synthase
MHKCLCCLIRVSLGGNASHISSTTNPRPFTPLPAPKLSAMKDFSGIAPRHRKYMESEEEMPPPEEQRNASIVSDMIHERLQELSLQSIPSDFSLLAEAHSQSGEEMSHAVPSVSADNPIVEPKETPMPESAIPFIFKALQRVGCSSRREALNLCASGDVTINGAVCRDAFTVVRPEDDIRVSGIRGRLRFAAPRLWKYHKPRMVSTSTFDNSGRDLFIKHARILGVDHVIPVGSLPFTAHGLMLLTNDGILAQYLDHPSTNIQRTYRLRVAPAMSPELVNRLNEKGVDIDGVRYNDYDFFVDPRRSKNYVLVKVRSEVIPVYEVMKHLGRVIKRGSRTGFGPFDILSMSLGSIKEAPIPQAYLNKAGDVWKPFIERDWPFFRRLRIMKLKSLARYRALNQDEIQELEAYSFDEVKDSISFSEEERQLLSEQAAFDPIPSRPIVDVALSCD